MAIPITFPLMLQTVINVRILSTGGRRVELLGHAKPFCWWKVFLCEYPTLSYQKSDKNDPMHCQLPGYRPINIVS